ncbi:MAG: MlaD family protein [Vampirovibrionia bacterium]
MKFKHEMKVGIFIIASIFLLTYIILWLHKFDMSSYLNIKARFEDAGTLNIGSNVLFRGVKAGTVEDITISPDGKYALVDINITNKKIILHEGDEAYILDKGFTGTKVVAISPPRDVIQGRVLVSGDTIEGMSASALDEIQKSINNLSDEMTFESVLKDLHNLLANTNQLTIKLDKLIANTEGLFDDKDDVSLNNLVKEVTTVSRNMNQTSIHLNKILTNKNFSKDLKNSIKSTSQAMEKFNKVADKTDTLIDKTNSTVNNLDSTVTKIDKTFNDPDLHGSIRSSMEKMSTILTDIQDLTSDKELKNNLKGAIKETNHGITRINCLGKELSTTLSKRFLLPRMMLGNPGKNIDKCSLKEISEVTNTDNTEK